MVRLRTACAERLQFRDHPCLRGQSADRGAGSASSKHAETDIELLRHLSRRVGTLYTTEPTVHQRAGIPLLEARPRSGQDKQARAGLQEGQSTPMRGAKASLQYLEIRAWRAGARAQAGGQGAAAPAALPRRRSVGAQRDGARRSTARTRSISSTRHPSSTRSCLGCTKRRTRTSPNSGGALPAAPRSTARGWCSALARGSAPKCARCTILAILRSAST